MKILDIIVPLPLTIEQYQRGQVYLFSRASMEDSTRTDCVEVFVNDEVPRDVLYQREPLTCAEFKEILKEKNLLSLSRVCGCDHPGENNPSTTANSNTSDIPDSSTELLPPTKHTNTHSKHMVRDETKMRKLNLEFEPETIEDDACDPASEEGSDCESTRSINATFQKNEIPNRGRITQKRYHLDKFLPGWLVTLLPHSATILNESSLNFFPHTMTWYKNPWLENRFDFSVCSHHIDGIDEDIISNTPEGYTSATDGSTLPILGLRYPVQKPSTYCGIHLLDVGDISQLENTDNDRDRGEDNLIGDLDPVEAGMVSGPRWWETHRGPMMIAVKRITVKFHVFGFQKRTEEKAVRSSKQFILRYHRKLLAWASQWMNMSMDEIRAYEQQAQEHLAEAYGSGSTSAENIQQEEEEAHILPEEADTASVLEMETTPQGGNGSELSSSEQATLPIKVDADEVTDVTAVGIGTEAEEGGVDLRRERGGSAGAA